MRLLLCLLFCISFSYDVNAQAELKKELDSITTTEDAKQFIADRKWKGTKMITFNEEKHKTRLAKELLKVRQGGSKIVKNELESVHYKVIEKSKIQHFRVSLIYLDAKKMAMDDIQFLRDEIISKYNNGVPFAELAKKYSMDRSANQGGDLGWFTYGEMLPEFEAAATDASHDVDDIFKIDIASKQWYYVVLKTFEPKKITEIKVLKVVESKR